MAKETELKILEDYLEEVHQGTDGQCPVCGEPDYPVNGDLAGYDEVAPEDAEEYHCDHDDDCAVTAIEKFLTAWETRHGDKELVARITALEDDLLKANDLCVAKTRKLMAENRKLSSIIYAGRDFIQGDLEIPSNTLDYQLWLNSMNRVIENETKGKEQGK